MKIIEMIRAAGLINLGMIALAIFLLFISDIPVWAASMVIAFHTTIAVYCIWQHVTEERELQALYEAYQEALKASEVKK